MNRLGLQCPTCFSEDHITLAVTRWVKLSKSGAYDPIGAYDVSPTTRIRCTKCGYYGYYHELRRRETNGHTDQGAQHSKG